MEDFLFYKLRVRHVGMA